MRSKLWAMAAALLVTTACGSATTSTSATTAPDSTSTVAGSAGTDGGSASMDAIPEFQVVDAGTYYLEPDPGTPLRVSFTVPEGWRSWVGTYKEDASNADEYVGLTIGVVDRLSDDPCRARTFSDPGPSVADLAEGLATLPGIVVVEAPSEVSAFGFAGQHLLVEVPDIPFDPAKGSQGFLDCVGGEFHAYEGALVGRNYQGPRQSLEFWVLDVDGRRLMIEKTHFPQSTPADMAELDAVVDSIVIVP